MPDRIDPPTEMQGLSEATARARLLAEGPNELPRADQRTLLAIISEVVREPMLALLIAAGIVYLLLGDLQEALILIVFAMLSIVITVVQEARTERVLEALRDLTSPRALVIRDGERKRIAGREVVRGDLVALGEGDRVPADVVLIQCDDLDTDESLLTGESVPVRKVAIGAAERPQVLAPGGDDLPFAFSGSLVVRGRGIGEVVATGAKSEIGKIGQTLAALDTEPPRLQTESRRVVTTFAIVGAGVSILAIVLYGALQGKWLSAALGGIALGMSMLPEEIPVVLTVFMAMGAWRISRVRVLTRRAAAIETLGAATVLCTDKTGTLTENRMAIVELRLLSGEKFRPAEQSPQTMPGPLLDVLEFGLLASAEEPFDPMEKAFHELGYRAPRAAERGGKSGRKLVHVYGLRPGLLAVSQVWRLRDQPGLLVAAKGAPEAVGKLCRLSQPERAAMMGVADSMAGNGLRVLGVARAFWAGDRLPESQTEFTWELLGLVGLADPLRPNVPDAVKECRSAGIRVVMITGDYPTTARAVARQAGIDIGQLLAGTDLDRMSDAELAGRIGSVTVFARTMPEQKLRIVNALKANGEIVAMTGDGVNDAPSLKAAHIGIAMGRRGTDVAREASSIVLLNDDFGSIVESIRLGRRIYDNLQKVLGFIFAVHVPIAGMALLPLIFGLPILFGPVHIAFLEMIIDPVCSMAFEVEAAERNIMRRPPRPTSAPLFSASLMARGLLQGVVVLAFVAGIYTFAVLRGLPENEIRALTFFALVFAIIDLIFANRSASASLIAAFRRSNWVLSLVLFVVAAILALTLTWPVARTLFRFGPLHFDDLALAAGAGAVVLVVLELVKLFFLHARRARPEIEL